MITILARPSSSWFSCLPKCLRSLCRRKLVPSVGFLFKWSAGVLLPVVRRSCRAKAVTSHAVHCWGFLKVDCEFSREYFMQWFRHVLISSSIPDTILFLSYWYTSKELPRRLSLYWTAYAMTSVIGAFMAFGFLHVHINGYAGWRCLFAFEGLITGVVGLIAGLYLPSSPTQTKTLLSRNGWFNEREEKIMVNRVLRDDPGKGDMHNRQALSPKLLLKAFSDFDLLPIYIIGLTWGLPTSPSQQYITLQLKSLGFDTFQTSLLTIPAYVLFIIQLIWWTWVAERTNQRMLVGVFAEVYNLACCIALRVLPDDASHWARWVLSTLLVGSPYIHAEIVSVTSRNAGSVRTRTVATAMYNMTVQASSIIGTNVSETLLEFFIAQCLLT